MFFKKKEKVVAVIPKPKKTQTIQERMDEVYNWHVKQFLKEKEAGKVDINVERKLSWYSFDNAVVGCTQDETVDTVYSKKQVLGVHEVNQLAQKACDIVRDKFIKFAESEGYVCTNKDCDLYDEFHFSAEKRKNLDSLEKEIDSWQP